ncbi:MAG TPA: glycoside hydrolase family 38 C-terminal domain-containing protein, partial [Phycisphaeraceae bacterium]
QPDGQLTFVHAPPYGVGEPVLPVDSVAIHERDDRIILENATLRAELHKDGRLLSLIHKPTSRETIEPGRAGNLLELSDDRPTMWEAWDVDPFITETQRPCPPAQSCRITCAEPLRAEVTFSRPIGRHSSMTQVVRLDAGSHRLEFHCEVDWQETQKMLKVAFPLNVWSMRATYETQFGAVERPTHDNHAIALAQFEVPGHRWADLSEHGFGAALLSESKYGYSCRGSTLRMSLLRSTTMPDPAADRGPQRFSYALYPHRGSWQAGGVVAEGLRFNYPLLVSKGQASNAPVGASLFHLDDPNLICDTVKLAEDGDAVVLRLYECHGARGIANLTLGLPFRSAAYCNILEDEASPPWPIRHQRIEVPYTPYRLISLKLYPR